MDQIERELMKQIRGELPAYEMATSLSDAKLFMMNRADPLLEHFLKVVLYPNDINQNKWRNEMSTKLMECGNVKSKASNKKFNKGVYELVFTTFCSFLEELQEQVEGFCEQFVNEGMSRVNCDQIDYNQLYSLYMELMSRSVELIVSTTQKFKREDFRPIIDSILKGE